MPIRMSLISTHLNHGNLKIYDTRTIINLQNLRPDFNRLKLDPYFPNGSHKHQRVHLRYENNRFTNILDESHSIDKNHPPFTPYHQDSYHRILSMFVKAGRVPDGGTVLLQAQRAMCSNEFVEQQIEDWHRKGVETIGIFCVDRHNITGGVTEFINSQEKVLKKEISPGYFAIFDDRCVKHRVTPIVLQDISFDYQGYYDTVYLAYPAFSRPRVRRLC